MWNKPTEKQLARIPRLYETEKIPAGDKIIHLHFFIGGCDWYIAEFDGDDTFFGYACLNDPENAEWGYISYRELCETRLGPGFEIDREVRWTPKPFKEC